MDKEKQQTGILHDSPAVGSDAEPKTNFPPELLAEIATHLHSDNPVETANNLANFQLASRQVRDAVQASPVALFHARVNRLGASARALYEAAIPDDLLPEHPEMTLPAVPSYHPTEHIVLDQFLNSSLQGQKV